MTPLVSIVIPCFNAEHTIARAIDSALGQTYSRVEVIVVDDGSSDGSVAVLRSLGDRIRWESGPNRGACAARNRGLQLSEGELIQFLDADDILLPDKLALQVPLALDYPNHVVFTDGWHDQGSERFTLHAECPDGMDPIAFAITKWVQTSSPLHHRSNLQNIGGFRETLPCCQELDMHLRLAIAGMSFKRLGTPLYRRILTPGCISSDKLRALTWRREIFTRASESLVLSGGLNDARRKLLARAFTQDGLVMLTWGQRGFYRANVEIARSHDSVAGLDLIFHQKHKRFFLQMLGPSLFLHLVEMKMHFAGLMRKWRGK